MKDTASFWEAEWTDDNKQRVWELIRMEKAEELLNKERKPNHRFLYLDNRVKIFLEDIWKERLRWIRKRTFERNQEVEARREERRRQNSIVHYFKQAADPSI